MKGPADGKIRFTLDLRADLVNGLRARAKSLGKSYTAYLEGLLAADLEGPRSREAPTKSYADWYSYQAVYWAYRNATFTERLLEERVSKAVIGGLRELLDDHFEDRFGPEPDAPPGVNLDDDE